jgi:adenosylmethionine-8-amino-7-oxononanoate aminotransferase
MKTDKKLIQQDKEYIWHPFTQMADWVKDEPSAPLIIESGKGNYLYDSNGKKYLDGVSSLWVTVHGHRKKEIDNAIKKQLGKIAHSTFLGLTHEPAINLAKRLIYIAPGKLKRVFYSDNGSTSVEVALKMAYQYWLQKGNTKKNKFLSFVNAYHGDTIGSVSVGGMELFHSKFRPMLFKAFHAPSPYCYRCSKRSYGSQVTGHGSQNFKDHCEILGCKGQCLKGAEDILKKHSQEIAAVVIEPLVQGAAGMLVMPTGFLKGIEKLCRKYNVLLICDEVATGFGRTGKMFAVEHESVSPDLMCLSKGITGGYLPLAVTLATEEIYKAFLGKFDEYKTFFHGHTYTANPLACAAAIASLDIFKNEKVLDKLPAKIEHLKNELSSLKELKCVGDIRQKGLMVGIELVKERATKQDFPDNLKIGARVCAACRPRGLMIRPLGNILVLMPPLSITKFEISFIIKAIHKTINSII